MSGKRIAAIVILAVVGVSLVALLALGAAGGLAGGQGSVAVVDLRGPIQDGAGGAFGGPAITPGELRDWLEQAEQRRVDAVVLRVDSPGGTVAASQELATLVRDFSRPVVVSMGDTAASGGYYLASQADHIVAHPGTLTGSIGVIWSVFDPAELFDKLGVELDTVTAGEHKDMFVPGRLTDERREIVQDLVDEMYAQFVGAVASGRDLAEDEVRELATGQVYVGTQAFELGLVDELGGLQEAIRAAEDLAGVEDARVVEFQRRFLDQLLGAGVRSPLAALVERGTGVGELAVLRQLIEGHTVPRYQLP